METIKTELAALIFLAVLVQAAAAYECNASTLGWWTLNESTGTNFINSCNTGNLTTDTATVTHQITGVFNWAANTSGASGHINVGKLNLTVPGTSNNTGTATAFINASGQNPSNNRRAILGKLNNVGGEANGLHVILLDVNATYKQLQCYVNATNIDMGLYVPYGGASPWMFVACVYNGTHMKGYVNNTNATIAYAGGTFGNGAYNYSIGAWGEYVPGNWAMLYGSEDEITLWNAALTDTQINNIRYYGNITGLYSPPTGTIGCNITLDSPATGYHSNDATPEVWFTPTCYQSMATTCYPYTNDTSTTSWPNCTPVNGTSCSATLRYPLLANLPDGNYSWYVNCSNGTVTNSSATRSLVIDTALPVVMIGTPTANQNFKNGSTNNLNINCTDNYAWNFTAEIYNNANSSIVATYNNGTTSYGNTTYTLINQFTSTLAMGQYWLNATCMDSHTKKEWKADQITNDQLSIKIKKDGKWLELEFENQTTTTYENLTDRIKWSFTATINDNGNIREVVKLKCDDPLYLLNASNAHFVCGNYWTDFQDLYDQGYTFEINQINDQKYKVKIKKNNAGEPGDTILLDPATGGLNTGYALANFTITTPTVTLISPLNLTNYWCAVPPCNITFYYNATNIVPMTQAWLLGNFSGTWQSNATNTTILNNSVYNYFTISLGYGTYLWNVNASDGTSNGTAPANLTLTIGNVSFFICNGSGFPILNFTFGDEENQTAMAADFLGTFNIYNPTRTANLTLNISANDTRNATICINPNGTYLIDSFQLYNSNGTGYEQRAYFLVNASINTSTIQNITLYLLESYLTAQISVTLRDESGVPIGNTYLYFDRYYVGENLYRTVAMSRTSADTGEASTYLRPNDAWYRITIVKDFETITTYTSRQIPCDPAYTSCPLTLTATLHETGEWYSYAIGDTNVWSHPCTWTNATLTLSCSWLDTTGLAKYGRLQMWWIGLFTPVQVCDTNSTGTSGTILCTLAAGANGTYNYIFTIHHSEETTIDSNNIYINSPAMFAAIGIFPALILFLTLCFVGSWNPAISLGLGFVGLIAAFMMGLLDINTTAIVAIGVLIGMAIYKMRT